MPDSQRLDPLAVPLTDIQLIEASAGTGKTWTITALYLRLVLEAGRSVDQILVVTYTVAATEELRDRIRRRLLGAREAFERGNSDDEFYTTLLSTYPDRVKAITRLTNALRSFDEAAIFTIHGFCQRVLSESAFESAMPFQTEVLADEREILQEIVDDFWRRECYAASPLFIEYLLVTKMSPDEFMRRVHPHLGKLSLKVLVPASVPNLERSERALQQTYNEVRALWRESRDQVARLLLESKSLNGNKYRKASVHAWLLTMGTCLAPRLPQLGLFRSFKYFDKFTASTLAQATKKGLKPPQHPFFDRCDELNEAWGTLQATCEQRVHRLTAGLLAYAERELVIRKRRRQVQSYNDLLLNLHSALHAEHGQALARTLRTRYSAALIDEFQDTDQIQYQIFDRIYGASSCPVFLVGDPKQAIYSFRGADVYAYLAARKAAHNQYTLDINWRSDPGLIQAVNALFSGATRPFLFESIAFHPVSAAACEREPLIVTADRPAPFRFWFLERNASNKLMTKGEANIRAARATAAEISRLLNLAAGADARIAGRSLGGGDIAVLVRSHRQGDLIREALAPLGIASVRQAQDSVFDSWEALELERVLMAVAEPGRQSLVRAALATDMLGVSGATLYRLVEDEQAWEARMEAFHHYHRLWREHGFSRFFHQLMTDEKVSQRLLGFPDGDRRLTNLRHLAELLQLTASRERTGMEGLVKWLSEERRAQGREDEEKQLRLESDENLVKIVTVHKSKGLEYAVVFCPFLWEGRSWVAKDEIFTFHDPDDADRATLDIGSDAQAVHRQQARQEECAENLRLLYVALTRAKHRCYVIWGAINEAGASALAWLLHQPDTASPARTPAQVASHFSTLSDEAILNDLEKVARCSGDAIAVETMKDATGNPYQARVSGPESFSVRQLSRPIPEPRRTTSFSALTAGLAAELPDYDAALELGMDMRRAAGVGQTIFDFPRGARAGRCLHAIFEQLDFSQANSAENAGLVERCLVQHGFEARWTPALVDMVRKVLNTPLDALTGLRLAEVTCERRLNELEFHYPLARLQVEGLRDVLLKHGYSAQAILRERIEALSFRPTLGYMTGFIDLVFEANGRFYLVDYKSNWLGSMIEDYVAPRLLEVMGRDNYYLQYLVYTVALHRYLKQRLPAYDYDSHFGGVMYLFLRGMEPRLGASHGVYRDRPARDLLEALDSYFRLGRIGN